MKIRKRFWIGLKKKKSFDDLFKEFADKYSEVMDEFGSAIDIFTFDLYRQRLQSCIDSGETDSEFFDKYKDLERDYDKLMSAGL